MVGLVKISSSTPTEYAPYLKRTRDNFGPNSTQLANVHPAGLSPWRDVACFLQYPVGGGKRKGPNHNNITPVLLLTYSQLQ